MNVCATKMNADRLRRFPPKPKDFKTGAVPVRSFCNQLSREIVMSRKTQISRLAIAACAMLLPVGSALASQGPGGGMGTASNLTQVTMAVLVYGTAALIVSAGLIGALRRR
jgi:hypothetical protein